jgi:hypothetical protein
MKKDSKQAKNSERDEAVRSIRAPRSISSVSSSLIAARSTTFFRRAVIVGRRLPAANIPAFLEYLFGVRPTISDVRVFRGELVHKNSGRRLHQSFHTWIVKPVLPLTVNWLFPSFSLWFSSWLSQVYKVETTLKTETKIHSLSARQAQAKIQRVFLKQFFAEGESKSDDRRRRPAPVDVSAAPLTQRAAWIPVESEGMTANPEGGRQTPISVGSISDRIIRRGAAAYFMTWPGLNQVSILSPVSWAGAALRRFHPLDVGAVPLQSRAFIVAQPRAERERPDRPQPRDRFREARERRGVEDLGSIVGAGNRAIFKHLAVYGARQASPDRLDSSARPAHREFVSRQPEALAGGERWFGSNRELIPALSQSYQLVSKERLGGVGAVFTSLRREEQMRHLSQSYAYAQPMRPVMEEEQVIKREREIVEIVRKEVETSINSRSSMTELTRADYSRITDHVWLSLSRRLVREMERLGHRYWKARQATPGLKISSKEAVAKCVTTL